MTELAKAYEPQQVEDRLYAKWQDGQIFSSANPEVESQAALLHRHAAAQRDG